MLSGKVLASNLHICTRCIRAAGGDTTANGSILMCPVSKDQARAHYTTGKCNKKLLKTLDATPETPSTPVQIGGAWGPAMWKRLHTATDADEAWLMAWSRKVPCGDCAKHWTAILKELPPVYGEGWFEWTWRAHNAVNAKLGKPIMTLDEARRRITE